ncbi:MAG: rRNA pseudouridine synthase [Archangiaceae bacterium]|nr:rRNA pseudouridine synthase [Archangiaceae bacterium]
MSERLQKFLARAGVASRRAAETLITAGRVTVNGLKVTELGSKVDAEKDQVSVDGKPVTLVPQRTWYLLNKPEGVVTTLTDPQGRATIGDFVKSTGKRLFPVGRLDYDAEGALLLTDDGEISNRLLHPRYQVSRTYLVKVKGDPTDATLDKLRGGVRLEDGMAAPAKVERFDKAEANTWLEIVVTEGRPHLVKRLCAAIGHPVVRLFRPAQAGIAVGDLAPGELRPLTPEEVDLVGQVAQGVAAPPIALKLPPRRHRKAQQAAD